MAKQKRKSSPAKPGRKTVSRVQKPALVVFACSRTTEKNLAGDRINLKTGTDIPVIPVMCSGRLGCAILLEAFKSGADGVLVAGCSPDECRFGFGARHGANTVARTQKILSTMGIESKRLRFSGGKDLVESFNEFRKSVASLNSGRSK